MRLLGLMLALVVMITSACATAPTSAPPTKLPYLKATPDGSVAYVAIIGDSYTSGLPGSGKDLNEWPSLVTASLHQQGVAMMADVGATDGAGYVTHGTLGSVPFIDQVGRVVGKNDDLVILFGASHDVTSLPANADRLAQEIQRTLAKALKNAPRASLLVVGPASVESPSADLFHLRDIMESQAAAVGARFVDPLAEQWFDGHADLIGTNGNPNQSAHVVIAARMAPLIAQQLQSPHRP